LATGPINRSIQEKRHVQILVRNNNVDQALRVLKKKMQREGVFREMKSRRHYESPPSGECGAEAIAAPASSPAKSCSTKVCCR
jgi:small subunit ribosomal protein S21